jgi:hypothetical protein
MILYIKLFALINLFYLNSCYKYNIKNILNNTINVKKNSSLNNNTIKFLKTNNTNSINTTDMFKFKNNTEIIPYLQRRSKFCHIKCNCFFSHNVVNDNICIPKYIKYT